MYNVLDFDKYIQNKDEIQTFDIIADNKETLQIYLKEIGKIKLLDKETELKIGKEIIEGDKKQSEIAKKKLAQANLRLVVNIARKYVNQGVPFIDLIQEGSLGLMKAVQKFDYKKGFRFSTYATWWIKQTIIRAVANNSRAIRIPVHMCDKIRTLKKAMLELGIKLGREASDIELADFLNLSEKKIKTIKHAMIKEPISIHTPIAEDLCIEDYIADNEKICPENKIGEKFLKTNIEDVIKKLPQREQYILEKRFGLNESKIKTLEEIGIDLNFSKERIRQLQYETIKKLKRTKEIKELKEYLY